MHLFCTLDLINVATALQVSRPSTRAAAKVHRGDSSFTRQLLALPHDNSCPSLPPCHPLCGWATLESHLAIRIVNLPNEFASQVAPRGIPRIESPQVEIVLTASEAIIVAIYLRMYVYQL